MGSMVEDKGGWVELALPVWGVARYLLGESADANRSRR